MTQSFLNLVMKFRSAVIGGKRERKLAIPDPEVVEGRKGTDVGHMGCQSAFHESLQVPKFNGTAGNLNTNLGVTASLTLNRVLPNRGDFGHGRSDEGVLGRMIRAPRIPRDRLHETRRQSLLASYLLEQIDGADGATQTEGQKPAQTFVVN